MSVNGFDEGAFRWMLGIEDTSVYPSDDYGMNALDEHELTGHNGQWKADFDAVARLGATGLRYGVSWPLVHTGPGQFDWSVLDERLPYAVQTLGLMVVADMVHYGTPTWLENSFADIRYPDAIAEFSGAFAERYRGLVDHITPLNEPLTTASFCGLRGVWPPALHGWDGWTTVTLGIVEGIRRSVKAIRAANPDAVIVHVEASSLFDTSHLHLGEELAHLSAIAVLPTDLVLGLVDPEHPMWTWLLAHGATPDALHRFVEDSVQVDLLGVNYYPDLTPRTLRDVGGEVQQHTRNGWTDGLRLVLDNFALLYGLPIVVTETSIEGGDELRKSWIEDSTELIQELRLGGLDVRGYTWWPLTDFVDWSYASNGQNVEEFVLDHATTTGAATERYADVAGGVTPFLRRMGLLTLEESDDGVLNRVDNAAAAAFKTAVEKK
jgi:beta-glucosidase